MDWALQLYAQLAARLDAVDSKLDQILANQKEEIMDLAALTAQVTQNTTVEQSAITLIQGLAAQLVANANDPAAIAALAASLNTSATSLAAAVTANTPAA
jgi:hypothetical protein